MANPNYYAIVPANVRYDRKVSSSAKLLYGEITALCNEKGFCWARNHYFEQLYSVGKNTVIRWIKELEEGGYIVKDLQYDEDGKTVIGRCLSIASNDTRWYQKCDPEGIKNDTPPGHKNDTHNNTRTNTTSNNNLTPNGVKPHGIMPNHKNTKSGLLAEVEAYTANPALREALLAFIEAREVNRKKLTLSALQLNLKKLSGLAKTDEGKIAIVNQSIERGWQGLFALKEPGGGRDNSMDALQEALNAVKGR